MTNFVAFRVFFSSVKIAELKTKEKSNANLCGQRHDSGILYELCSPRADNKTSENLVLV